MIYVLTVCNGTLRWIHLLTWDNLAVSIFLRQEDDKRLQNNNIGLVFAFVM